MANADVSRRAVQEAMKDCVSVAKELQEAHKSLNTYYSSAGSGWADSKYREIGEIVKECMNAIKKPVAELNDCFKTLKQLDSILAEYEGI